MHWIMRNLLGISSFEMIIMKMYYLDCSPLINALSCSLSLFRSMSLSLSLHLTQFLQTNRCPFPSPAIQMRVYMF